MSFWDDKNYKEKSSVERAIEYLRKKGFSGFIVNRGGPGGVDIICNRNGHLCIVEVKGTSGRKLTIKDVTSKSKELKGVLQTSLEYLKHYTEKGRHETIVEKEMDNICRESEHPMVIVDKLSEIEQTKQALARYVTGKGNQTIERILYVDGGAINSELQNTAKQENFTIIHNDRVIVKSQTFDYISGHPDEGSMPAIPTPDVNINVDDLFNQYGSVDNERKTEGDIE